jgi:cysteine desulfurase / selenocysteine lyase
MYKKDFPLLRAHPSTVYLDSASTAQKPDAVVEALTSIFTHSYANIHRWSYTLSDQSEALYDASKEKMRAFLHAESRHEIVYTYNATYAFNYLARSLVKSWMLVKWDRILLSVLDHHANIVPWQMIAEEYGMIIDWIAVTPEGRLDYASLESKVAGARLVAVTAASNVTGTIIDIANIRDIVKKDDSHKILVIDGSQSLPHFSVDVADLDIDFFIATGHKVMSDTGIGILYGKKALLQKLSPALCWGGSINFVTQEGYEPAGLPYRHEPGTPHIAWAASLLAALTYIDSIGWYTAIEAHERELVEYTLSKIATLPHEIRLIGPLDARDRLGIFAFAFSDRHPSDVADMLADKGICVRVWHHCTEPLHRYFWLDATLRMSLYIYNTKEDIDRFFEELMNIFPKSE